MSSIKTNETVCLRKANDVFAEGIPEAACLFDEFWREGEVALLFGSHGVGKSFLAVEIAEALARGRPIPGLTMPETRRNVLYVDLVLSDAQFGYRYSWQGRKDRRNYRFSANLHRDSPPDGEKLIDWLRRVVKAVKVDVIVIDDLSVVSPTDDGTQVVLELVRELRLMARRQGISALVLADSHPYAYNREAAESDLRRRRVLCSHADSVFALSANGNSGVWRKLVQTRTQSDDMVWTQRSPATFRLRTRDDGFVGFDFVEAPMTEEERATICRIKALRDREEKKVTFREIADRLDITKSRAARLYGKWRPSLELAVETQTGPSAERNAFNQREPEDGLDIYGFDYRGDYHYEGDTTRNPFAAAEAIATGRWLPEHIVEQVTALAATVRTNGQVVPQSESAEPLFFKIHHGPNWPADGTWQTETTVSREPDWLRAPLAAALRRRSILDLEPDFDHNDVPIYVESRREHDGKPLVWYQYNPRSKTYTRWERTTFATRGKNLGRSHYLSRGS